MTPVATGLWKGCLGGIGLAFVYFIISGLTYLVLIQIGLPLKSILFVTVASGPIIGTFGLIAAVLWVRARTQITTATKIDSEPSSAATDE